MRNLVFIWALCMGITSAWAQGNNSTMGGDDKDIMSISERLLKVEKKTEALNVFLNLNTSYQERFDGEQEGGSFVGNHLRFEMKGLLNEKWSYRFRYRLNRPGRQQDDNFSDNIDFMLVNFQVTDRFRLTAGKKEVTPGGFEWDYNPIQVIEYSEFANEISDFHLALQAGIKINKNHELMAEVFNANNDNICTIYPEAGLERSKHPLGVAANWTGSMWGGRLQTLWTVMFKNEAKDAQSWMLALGQKLNMRKWQLYVDYYGGWQDVDSHGIVSRETGTLERNVRYHSVVAELNVQPLPHWNLFAKGMVEMASVNGNEALKNYRTSYGYQAGVQWYPDLTQNCKLSLAYIGRTVHYKSACGLDDYNTNRLELSLIYRMKIF